MYFQGERLYEEVQQAGNLFDARTPVLQNVTTDLRNFNGKPYIA